MNNGEIADTGSSPLYRRIAEIVMNAEPIGPAADAEAVRAIIANAEAEALGDEVDDGDPEILEEMPEEGTEGAPSLPAPKDWGFDIDRLNAEWAFVLMGSKAMIIREQTSGPIEDRVRVLSIDAFRALFSNRPTQVGTAEKITTTTYAKRWLAHRRRRTFDGIEFFPNPDGAEATAGYLNLWRGFSVEPKAKVNGWAVLRDHMLNNVCRGDAALFEWLFGWFAHMMQRPRERIGTAVVMRGRMGVGKSVVGEYFGSLIASHYFLVGDARYITGNFNAHMASCLLLQAEEAVWAGDKAAEGRLKDLVTAEIQMIEQKSIDPIRLKNFVRLLMTSNEDWVVPAGKDERRFAVFDVDPRRRCRGRHGRGPLRRRLFCQFDL